MHQLFAKVIKEVMAEEIMVKNEVLWINCTDVDINVLHNSLTIFYLNCFPISRLKCPHPLKNKYI